MAPLVSITAPSTNAQLTQGDNITITANATDADGTIAKVEFYKGNTLLGTDTSAPYSFVWSNLPAGSFSLTAKATDNKGMSTTSSAITINVKEVIIPEIIIITPVQNQEFEEGTEIEIMVMFEGSDESVKLVEYYSGNQLIGSSNTSPFSFTWLTPTLGQHTITAKAIGDDHNRYKISESISILVKEKSESVFRISDPIKDAVFNAGELINIKVEIPENSKPIMRVDFYRGNIRMGSSTSAPYDYFWNNSPQGDHNLSAQLIFMDGSKLISSVVPIKVLKRNQAVVKLISSNNLKEIKTGENIDLKVEILEFDEKVEFVEYLLDGEKLGNSNTYPFNFTWHNIPEGDHQLVAKAIAKNGMSVTSEPTILSARKDINSVRLEYVIGPNPTTEFLNVIFTNLDGVYDFEFRVISMNGIVQKTFNAQAENSKVTIDVSNLINGVYVLQVIANGNNISSKKFIIKK